MIDKNRYNSKSNRKAASLETITRNTKVIKTKPAIIDSTSPVPAARSRGSAFPVNSNQVYVRDDSTACETGGNRTLRIF